MERAVWLKGGNVYEELNSFSPVNLLGRSKGENKTDEEGWKMIMQGHTDHVDIHPKGNEKQ